MPIVTYHGIQWVEERWKAEAAAAVNRVADRVLQISQQIVPFQVGTLAGTGHIESSASPGHLEATIAYNIVYAAYQHERALSHPNGRQMKYLERPLIEQGGPMLRLELARIVRG